MKCDGCGTIDPPVTTKPQKIEGGWEYLENKLDQLWPKGDKNRGKALVFFAYAQMAVASERQRCVGIANQEGLMFFKEGTTQEEMDRCGRIRKQMRKEIVDKIEQLK